MDAPRAPAALPRTVRRETGNNAGLSDVMILDPLTSRRATASESRKRWAETRPSATMWEDMQTPFVGQSYVSVSSTWSSGLMFGIEV